MTTTATPAAPATPPRRAGVGQILLNLALGFFGWYLANTLLWVAVLWAIEFFFPPTASSEGLNQLYGLPLCCVPGLANTAALVVMLVLRRWFMALGLLVGVVSNIALAFALDFAYSGQANIQTILSLLFGLPFYISQIPG
jgi:hypothetical protein